MLFHSKKQEINKQKFYKGVLYCKIKHRDKVNSFKNYYYGTDA